MDKFERYILRDIPEHYHERVLESHRKIGEAATKLVAAYEEYNQAIIERLALNEEIRHGN